MKMVRRKGFEPLNLYGRDLKSRAFGQLDYLRVGPSKVYSYKKIQQILSEVAD